MTCFNRPLLRQRRGHSTTCCQTHAGLLHRGRPLPLEALEQRVLLSSTWTVTTLTDTVADDGLTSLREAISVSASGDTIAFSPLLNGTITLIAGQLQILNKDLTIAGRGADILTVSGNRADRVFDIEGGNVSLSGLTIADGYTLSRGAGIYSAAPDTRISNCVFAGNSAEGNGGALYNSAGSSTLGPNKLTLTNCTFSSNVTQSSGAAVSSAGTLVVSGCTFDRNSAAGGTSGGGVQTSGTASITNSTFTSNSGGTSGGGVSNAGGATLTVTNCTFDHNGGINGGGIANGGTLTVAGSSFTNSSVDYGGGLVNYGTATLSNCTFSGNNAENGAGIRNSGTLSVSNSTLANNFTIDYGGAGLHNTGTASFTNCTFAGNRDGSGYGGAAIRNSGTLTLTGCTLSGNSVTYGLGGAIRTASPAIVVLRNTIVSGNIAQGSPDDISGPVDASSSHNLIGIGGGLTNGVNGNLVGITDPKLGSLASNGGPTSTMALLPGSPALDAGDNSLIPSGVLYDQRGPNHARIMNTTVDIGAYEFDPPPTVASISINDGAAQRSTVKKLTVIFSEPVTLTPGAVTLKLSSGTSVTGTTVQLSTSDWQTYALTFSGSAVIGGSLADGIYDLVVTATGVQDLAGTAMTANFSQRFHRLFGDADGNRIINSLDYARLKQTFGRAPSDPLFNSAFDFEANGLINALDLARFRQRYGMSYSY